MPSLFFLFQRNTGRVVALLAALTLAIILSISPTTLADSPQQGGPAMSGQKPPSSPSDTDWQARLTPDQFAVTRRKATEPPFSGAYWNHSAVGRYFCVCCGALLFSSDRKFDAGCGWPSFWEVASQGAILEEQDLSHGMKRTEVLCKSCGAHLGHVFDDGPKPTGLRYCINSLSLRFEPGSSAGNDPAKR